MEAPSHRTLQFTVTGDSPFPAQFTGDNSDGCVDVTIGPGEYTVSEVSPPLGGRTLTVFIEGNCEQESYCWNKSHWSDRSR